MPSAMVSASNPWILFEFGLQECLGLFAGLIVRGDESGIVVLLRGTGDAAEKCRVVHKKFGGQHASLVELLEKIAGGFGSLAHRIVRTRLLVGREISAGFHEIQLVQMAISAFQKMRGRIGLHYRYLLRGRSRSCGVRGSLGAILCGNSLRRKRARQQQARGNATLGKRAVRALENSLGKRSLDISLKSSRH